MKQSCDQNNDLNNAQNNNILDHPTDEKTNHRESHKEAIRALGRMSQLGLTGVTCVILSLLAGYGLDRLLGTSPIFIITFALLGSAAAIKAMVDIAKKF